MSFSYEEVKYFCPFYRNEEFWIKPKYYNDSSSTTILDILSDMFRRRLLDDESSKFTTERYWRKIIQEEHRVAVLLIFSDAIYRKYPSLEKPARRPNVNHGTTQTAFSTISRADTIIPRDLIGLFWPEGLVIDNSTSTVDERLKGLRLKLRVTKQHIHPRSIVVPYKPSVVFEDENLVAVNKPFGVPSMGETNDLCPNEWNSILTWCRFSTDVNSREGGQHCDLMNRLDLDVSGLVLLGKSGKYRKKRGFSKGQQRGSSQALNTVKVYLGIIPKQEHALRVTTPRLGFDKKRSKAIIKQQQLGQLDGNLCRTCIYPLKDLGGGVHSLVAICLEESGQRHQIRFHLSLIGAAIPNDRLYNDEALDGTVVQRRTGVSSMLPPKASPGADKVHGAENRMNETNPLVSVEQINEADSEFFLKKYVYVNGVTGFRETESHDVNNNYRLGLIRRCLYPAHERDFAAQLSDNFEFCDHCGKCAGLRTPEPRSQEFVCKEIPSPVLLDHGIYLHSWRYFSPTPEHPLLEADLTGGTIRRAKTNKLEKKWWPVEILRDHS